MREEQEKVRELIRSCHLETSASVRCLDLVSEVGEVAKELLKASDYGTQQMFDLTRETEEELGDCLFSLLAMCDSLGIDAYDALEGALEKYRTRWENHGSVGSGR